MLQPHQWVAVCWPDLVSNTENSRDKPANCRGFYFDAGGILLLCFGLAFLSVALSCFWAVHVGWGRVRAVPCFIIDQWSLLSWTSWKPSVASSGLDTPQQQAQGLTRKQSCPYHKLNLSPRSLFSVSKAITSLPWAISLLSLDENAGKNMFCLIIYIIIYII